MALASQTRSTSDFPRGLLRRPSQNSTSSLSSPVVEAVDFCRSKPKLVELENQLYSLANGNGKSQEVMKTCQSLLHDYDNINGIFNVFCSCSWVERYQEPIMSQLFYELISVQCDSSNGTFLLAELETACAELLKILTLLGTPNTLQFNVVSLLYNLSRLAGLPSLHQEAVQSYLEDIARALWPYSMASAPNLWTSDAFCDAQCDILKACGKFLEEKCPVNTERTFHMMNGKLISGDVSKYSRFRLLEIRELRSSGWKVSETTLNYYKARYLKLINQSRKDNLLVNDIHEAVASRNDIKRINSIGESNNQTNGKPVKVVRISENELRKSCENMQQELVTQGIIVEEENIVADHKSSSSVDCEELPAKQTISLNGGIKDCLAVETEPLNDISSKENPILHRAEARQSTENGSTSHLSTTSRKFRSSCEDGDEVASDAAKEIIPAGYPVSHVSHDLIEDSLKRAPSPCSSDGSDDVFAGSRASAELNIDHGNKVLPASHRGDFKKPRRPFKSDSSVTSVTESLGTRTAVLSDSKESKCSGNPTFARSHSADLTNSSKVPVQSVIDQVTSSTAFNGSQVVDEQNQSSNSVTENWRETKLPSIDKSDSSVTDTWRERPSVDLKEPEAPNNTNNMPNENWSGRKLSSTDKSDVNGHSSVTDNWRERPSVDLKEPESINTSDAPNGNWKERKISSTDKSDVNGHSSVTDNWRERPSVDLKEPEANNTSGNWKERNSDHPSDVWSSGSRHDNWRGRKSMSVDESTRDANSTYTASQRSKRYSTGDVQLERQNSSEKGKHSPGGGFGFPKPAQHEDHTADPSDEPPKQELVEVQITEEESQALRWWKLEEIQADTGCRIFHNRFKCVIAIRGDPQQCKVAKKRAYSVVAALQEEFGALVPLSDEVLQHLQTEGCNMLAERLAFSSAASVKMINDTQLFISGHRNCVNHAKAQLAKIKVMLRYTDDPDVVSPSQQDNSEEKHQRVEKLFAALEGRPRSLTDSSADQTLTEGGLSRDFLLSCALSPVARERPVDLSLDRTEDWIKDIVLVAGRRGEHAILESNAQKKGFGRPDSNSRRPSN